MADLSERKPFKTRFVTSLVVWLLIAFTLVSLGFFIAGPTDRSQMPGASLPTENLVRVTGKVVRIEYQADERRGTFAKPEVEFAHDGKTHRATTIFSYVPKRLPFADNQTAEVVFAADAPESAWLVWEYDRLRADYNGLIPRAQEITQTVFLYAAAGIIVLSGLLFAANLFFPVFRVFKR